MMIMKVQQNWHTVSFPLIWKINESRFSNFLHCFSGRIKAEGQIASYNSVFRQRKVRLLLPCLLLHSIHGVQERPFNPRKWNIQIMECLMLALCMLNNMLLRSLRQSWDGGLSKSKCVETERRRARSDWQISLRAKPQFDMQSSIDTTSPTL